MRVVELYSRPCFTEVSIRILHGRRRKHLDTILHVGVLHVLPVAGGESDPPDIRHTIDHRHFAHLIVGIMQGNVREIGHRAFLLRLPSLGRHHIRMLFAVITYDDTVGRDPFRFRQCMVRTAIKHKRIRMIRFPVSCDSPCLVGRAVEDRHSGRIV